LEVQRLALTSKIPESHSLFHKKLARDRLGCVALYHQGFDALLKIGGFLVPQPLSSSKNPFSKIIHDVFYQFHLY